MDDTAPATPSDTPQTAPVQDAGAVPPRDGARLFHTAMAVSEGLLGLALLWMAWTHARELL